MQQEEHQHVVVRDIQIPFFTIVKLMVVWSLASVPALIILGVLWLAVMGVLGGLSMMFY